MALIEFPEISFCVGLAPNVNSCGGIFKELRPKMEVAPTLLKAGTGAGSLIFGKPKLNKVGAATGGKTGKALPLSIDPKIFCSYSCNCW